MQPFRSGGKARSHHLDHNAQTLLLAIIQPLKERLGDICQLFQC